MQMSYLIKLCIWLQHTTQATLVPSAIHIPSFTKIGHRVLLIEAKVYLFCGRVTYIHPYIHPYRHRDNENLFGPYNKKEAVSSTAALVI